MTLDFAELIGILLGGGSIGIYVCKSAGKTNTQYRVKVTLDSEKDAEYVSYVRDLMARVLGCLPLVRKRKGEQAVDLCVYGQPSVSALLAAGLVLSPKWERARIPEKFTQPEFRQRVLSGYIDTDGCVAIVNNHGKPYPRVEFKISPSPMQSQLIQCLEKEGLTPQVSRLEKGKVRVTLAGRPKLAKWWKLIGSSNPKNIRAAKPFLESSGDWI